MATQTDVRPDPTTDESTGDDGVDDRREDARIRRVESEIEHHRR